VKRPLVAALAVIALAVPAAAAAFDSTEPLASKQWYLTADSAWAYWPTRPQLFPVTVAVIDSGIDGSNPDLEGRVIAARSFVGGSAYTDEQGHGTFVAGEIAANPANGEGIAGMAFNARLIVAKVVARDGTVSLPGEVAAIRWAADLGARVINLSLGGVRDPLHPQLDTYSPLEQAAVDYAIAKGVVVVAAVGNAGPESPQTPWRFADYPAALPHVIGVGAIREDGSVPDYSNRDAVYNDLAAPGGPLVSTIPSALEDATRPGCTDHPYSDCGPPEFRDAIGTSFAAPQVAAAAALLLGERPELRPEQVSYLLERSALDASTVTGCGACASGRDALTGWGMLDVAGALGLLASGPLPPADRYEPNDDAGPWSHPLPSLRVTQATLDYWDDQNDVYRVFLRAGQRLYARLTPAGAEHVTLALWPPGTDRVESLTAGTRPLAQSRGLAGQARLTHRIRVSGVYYLQAKLVTRSRFPVGYRLAVSRRSP
jgi:subtilisin family serine protease